MTIEPICQFSSRTTSPYIPERIRAQVHSSRHLCSPEGSMPQLLGIGNGTYETYFSHGDLRKVEDTFTRIESGCAILPMPFPSPSRQIVIETQGRPSQ